LSSVATTQLERGDVLTSPGWLVPTAALDVRIRLIPKSGHPLKHNTNVIFHSGAVEVAAKVRLLEKEQIETGESSWAQLRLARPVAVVKGDFFIIRSTMETLGGGEVVDAYPKRHRRFYSSTIEALTAREQGGTEGILLAILEAKEPLEIKELLNRSNLPLIEVNEAVRSLDSQKKLVMLGEKGSQALLFSAKGWSRLVDKAKQITGDYHRRFPLRHGIPKEELRSKLSISAQTFADALKRLLQDGILVEEGKMVRLHSHHVHLSKDQETAIDTFLESLTRNPYSPPGEVEIDPEILNVLIQQRRVVKVAEHVIFAASAYDEMTERIISYMKKRGTITVAEVRDLLQTSRKYALALMEYLDEQKITRRVGDERVLI
jgi:selenocysteine-specific elongation factor